MKIFWSWQDDRERDLHRYFVRNALKDACKLLTIDPDYNEAERPEVDHDTKGVPGTPDIAKTILDKITLANVFVADMTPIGITSPASLQPNTKPDERSEPKYLQNPNVMSELGYAEHAITQSRILLVANKAHYPGPQALPFDWRHRSGAKLFNLPDNSKQEDIKAERKRFAEILKNCIKEILAHQLPTSELSIYKPSLTSATLNDQIVQVANKWQLSAEIDPCVWPGAIKDLEYRNASLDLPEKKIILSPAPRIFVRLMPAHWKVPLRAELEKRISGLGLQVRARNGDWGLNTAGALSIWDFYEDAGRTVAINATQWFRETGELWGVNTGSFGEHKGRRFFGYAYPIKAMDDFIRSGIAGIQTLGGKGPFGIRIGAGNLRETFWPGRFESQYTKALDDYVNVEALLSSGDDKERFEVLKSFWNTMADTYGQPVALSDDEFMRRAEFKALID